MKFGSVCSGHDAVSQALLPRGWECAFLAEVEAFPCAVLAERFGATAPRNYLDPTVLPEKDRADWIANNKELDRMVKRGAFGSDVPNLGDFTKIDPAAWSEVEWLWGGTPCQAFSVAGARQGLKDHRGNLTLAFVGLAHELAATGSLRGLTWENVPGVLSSRDNAFGCFLGALAGHDTPIISPHGQGRWPDAGVVVGPRCRIAWRILDTQHFGLPQRRRRVFVVASFGDGPDPVGILFERQGVLGPAAPGHRARERIARNAQAGVGGGFEGGVTHDLAPTLVSSGRGVERIGETRGQDPVVAVAFGGANTSGPIEVATAQTAQTAHGGSHGRMDFDSETFLVHRVAKAFSLRGRDGENQIEPEEGEVAPAIRTGTGGSSKAFVAHGDVLPILEAGARTGTSTTDARAGIGIGEPGDPMFTLQAGKQHAVAAAVAGAIRWAVRRLMPTECEALQGTERNFTRIPWRGKPAEKCPDGPRYKVLGNSMSTDVILWIGERIEVACGRISNHG